MKKIRTIVIFACLLVFIRAVPCSAKERGDSFLQKQTDAFLQSLGLEQIDRYLAEEPLGELSFSELVKQLMTDGAVIDFAAAGEKIGAVLFADYRENRTVLLQILTLALAFAVLSQISTAMEKGYVAQLGFLGVYIILMLLLLKLFVVMGDTVEHFFTRLVEFMQLLQPVFCISVVFANGSVSAGAGTQLLLLIIYLVDVVFAKILVPLVQVYLILQLVNYMMDYERFSKIAELLSDGVSWCVKLLATAVIGLNAVQGLLAPGIDGVRRSTLAGITRAVPGAGQLLGSMNEILAGSSVLIKNSVGVAALVALFVVSFLPALKLAAFVLLYKGCAAVLEPVTDKRIAGAVASLGQAGAMYLKLMYYAVLLFFLTIAIICAATSFTL